MTQNMNEIVKSITQLKEHNIIESSIHSYKGCTFFITKEKGQKFLCSVVGDKSSLQEFEVLEYYEVDKNHLAFMKLTTKNRKALARCFDWMNPKSRAGSNYSFGLGDRLGLASICHLEIFKGRGVLPVLAQQSIRELNLTGRTFTDVLDSASWAVFESGYHDGFSADGDHLKNPFEVEYAIQCGFPMITLDCSEYIDNDVANYEISELENKYSQIGHQLRDYYESVYLDKEFNISDEITISFNRKTLMETVLIYSNAIEFMEEIYLRFVVPNNLDFEVSIDETIVPTSPENHFFIAKELQSLNVSVETMAPKFCGEFQKGIDYIGDIDQFKEEYIVHETIAKYFNYRLSIHSGSDKFSIFPIIGEVSGNG